MYKIILLLICYFSPSLYAAEFNLPPRDIDLVGGNQATHAIKGDTLLDIARRFDIGQEEILLANPDVDRWLPKQDKPITLPLRYILPDAPRTGVVLNLPEMRLYYYQPKDKKSQPSTVITHPVSVGRMDWDTPLGTTRIVQKKRNPTWTPPESIKKEHF